MEANSNIRALLEQIAQTSKDLGQNRGQHAAALWSVSDFLMGLDGALVNFVDPQPLGGGKGHLAILDQGPADDDRWGLFVRTGDELVPACKAEPEVAVSAIRRLPEFLTTYVKRMQSASGSKLSLSMARQLVEAVAEVGQT